MKKRKKKIRKKVIFNDFSSKKENRKKLNPIPSIPKIKTLANSGLPPAPSMRLASNKNKWDFSNSSLSLRSRICKDRSDRRRALFRAGKAGKIKVDYAKWTLKSLMRCK